MQHGHEQAGDRDPVAKAHRAALTTSMKKHPPEQQRRCKEADVLQAMHEGILERPGVKRGCMPNPKRSSVQRCCTHRMADESPGCRQRRQIEESARCRA